jgi:hypothetical protein
MSDLSIRARYLSEHVLDGVIIDRHVKLPQASPGSNLPSQEVREVLARISGRERVSPEYLHTCGRQW